MINKKRILIAEDQKVVSLLTKNIIMRNIADTICDVAENGKEALEMFVENKYDFILMDIEMPIMNGYETTEEIRRIDKNIPILAYSSLNENVAAPLAIKSGMNKFIPKLKRNLVEIIKSYLNPA